MSKRSEIIADFMAKLSVDPGLRRRFKEDPSSLKDESGLSDEELELLAGGGPDQVLDALGGDATVNCMIMFTSEG
ncbi:MAG TPA: hypothetical protein VKM72_16985 [Thermoanaerobaculia bacterium]|nr:hypothetical protein [Thermoanaerobaculia bacterium]